MSFTSLVIWLENAESFMKVIIRVIYRITPSYSQLHNSLLCNAGAAQVKREQKHPLQQKHPLVYLGQFANSHEFLSLKHRRLQIAWIERHGPYALQLGDEVRVLL